MSKSHSLSSFRSSVYQLRQPLSSGLPFLLSTFLECRFLALLNVAGLRALVFRRGDGSLEGERMQTRERVAR